MPSVIGFNVGGQFLFDDRHVQVTRVVQGGLITIEDIQSLVIYQYRLDDLLEFWRNGRIKPLQVDNFSGIGRAVKSASLDCFSQKQIEKAMRKKKYIDELLAIGGGLVYTPVKLKGNPPVFKRG